MRHTLLTWLSSVQEWRNLLLSTYRKHEVTSENRPVVEVKALEYGATDKVHCECAIVAHLHQYTTVPAFSYVGVSRLSFKPC